MQIRMLGPLDVWVNGEQLKPLRSRKGAWLLALLAMRGGREVERNWLEAVLWPDAPSEKASASLRQSLADLRRALGDDARLLQSPCPRTLRLDVSASEVDVLAFDQALARGDADSREEALALYRGALLEGCTEEWVVQERDLREQAFLSALEDAAAHDVSRGDAQQAISRLRRAVAADPLRESAQRGLMEALARAGDLAAAIVAYRDLRLLLRSELNADPDPQTTEVYERIRADARDRAQQPPTPAVQASVPRRETRLPEPLTPLIGRSKQTTEALDALAAYRLVTLVGPGGVGKTRLAVSLGRRLVPEFVDGVRFVDLSGCGDGNLLSATVASSLGVLDMPGQSVESSLVHHLQDLSALLVLDNCEHVIEASSRLVDLLLSGCPHLRILATSRQPLDVAGELTYRVPALSVPAPDDIRRLGDADCDDLGGLLSYDAVALFVERARAAHSAFALTPQNGATIAEIAGRLDGLPLAIELAAARVRAMPIEQIASRLDDRFRLLTSTSRSLPARHQALRAAMDWSYDLLDEGERALLRRLSVFSGGWTYEAADEVCSDPAGVSRSITPELVPDLLTELVDRSLVAFDSDTDGGRYRLLETVRSYARSLADEVGETAQMRDRHLAYFARLAESGGSLEGASLAGWFDAMEREHANLGAALEWCLATGHSEQGLRLAACLGPFWSAHGHRAEGRARMGRALAAVGTDPRSALRSQALLRAADLAWGQGDHAAAAAYARESLEIVRETGDRQGVALSLAMLGQTALGEGDASAARAFHEEGLAIFREQGDMRAVAATLLNLGEAARLRGESAEAVALYAEGRLVAAEAGSTLCSAVCEANLAALAVERGEADLGQAMLARAAEGLLETGNYWLVLLAMPTYASLALARGDSARAARLLGAAQALCESTGTAVQPADRAAHAEAVARTREACGADEFDREWREGAAMRLDEAIEYALGD